MQGGCFALALGALLRHVDGSGRAALGAAVLWTVAGLLVREDSLAVVPVLALLALVTGIVSSLFTKWGLFRYYWVLIKLVITVAATYGYTVRYLPVGPDDPEVGPPTQMAIFSKTVAA